MQLLHQRSNVSHAGFCQHVTLNHMKIIQAIDSFAFFLGLKLYNRTPPNGLVIYCGTIMTDDGKEKKVSIDFEPFKPINTSLYLCDNKVSFLSPDQ